MYSWKTVRTLCIVLLLLPLLHLAVLVSRETVALLNSSPEAWSNELDHYAALDTSTALPQNPILVVGGRRAWLWQDLEATLAPAPVLMRGLSGATLDDLLYHYERLIGFYRPTALVVIPGSSEFHIRDNKSVGEFVKAVQALELKDREHRAEGLFYFFLPMKSPLHLGDNDRIDSISKQLQAWAQDSDRVILFDANAVMRTPEGNVNPNYFRPDGTNLNEHGYVRLSLMLRQQLEQDLPETL
jgi:hypothetical protein